MYIITSSFFFVKNPFILEYSFPLFIIYPHKRNNGVFLIRIIM